MLNRLRQLLTIPDVYAHCDIPCGVYSGEPSRIAALAVLKLTEKIEALTDEPTIENRNSFVRMVHIKEREAQRCKDELLILWTDFFKPEHLEKYPNLHDQFWKAAKQCSTVKRTVSSDEARKLVDMVDKLTGIFDEADAAKK